MKYLLFLFSFAIIFSSCEKKETETKRSCPVVATKDLPASVTAAFQQKYPAESAIKWFNKDNIGYCVLFSSNGTKKLVQFDNIGNFVREEADVQQEGDHQDNEDDNECECETESD